jgi:signal transduction histidine kinase
LAKPPPRSPSAASELSPDLFELLPHPALADALQSRVEPIIRVWVERVRERLPVTRNLSFIELQDSLPDILTKMAESLRATDPTSRRELMERSPLQGITRFQQHYDVRELMTEDRLLRRVIVEQVEDALGRTIVRDEQIALHLVIDVMLQQAVVAFVDHQGGQLRSAAESELKYLSFLSHDLNNNLSNITVWLQVLKGQLQAQPQFADQIDTLDAAQQAILVTIGGMGRLLQAERLRKGGAKPKLTRVDLRTLVANETRQVLADVERKGLALTVDVPRGAAVESDPELITLALQNLISNAVKYTSEGSIRVRAERRGDEAVGRWAISVADEGPGIAEEHLKRIFDAFQRGDMHGPAGIGLGLAIASQAAKLLGAELSVESRVGVGSTFTLTLPGLMA